jgi:hypothetical protein
MKMRTAQWIGIGGLTALGFLGCSNVSKDTSRILVNVAGEKITEAQFQEVVKVLIGDDKKSEDLLKNDAMKEQRNQFLESLALQKSMIQMAKAEGVEKDLKAKVLLEQRVAQVYLQTLMDRRLPKAEPTETELKALYDGLIEERKAAGQDQGLPAFEAVKAQMPGIWKQKQEQAISAALFKELRQNYPITFAEGYKPTPQPGQP